HARANLQRPGDLRGLVPAPGSRSMMAASLAMQADLQAALIRRVLAHLEQRTTDTAAAPSTIPVATYTDLARYEHERARLFRELPLAIGHVSQLSAPRMVTRALSWKLGIDVFLEAYHLRPTHRNSIYGMFFDNVGLVDPIGPHLRNVFPKRTIRELAALRELPDQPETAWSLRRHANVLFHLFPNTLVLI